MSSLAAEHLEGLKRIVGESALLTDSVSLESYGADWTKLLAANPSCVVLPKTTEQVSEVVSYCHQNAIQMVPSGGRTGLAGGAIAANHEVVISLDKMNRIIEVDEVGLTMTVEAGVTTQAIQDAAKEVGLFFPLDLAAKGSCHIGGNLATNAGGVKLIRFGGAREQTLGIEVVLPDGRILDLNSSLRKNNSGYDLKQLFLGSEGTLGIITKATLRLVPQPRDVQVTLMAMNKFVDVTKVFAAAMKKSLVVNAFEFFTDKAHKIVLKHGQNVKPPFAEVAPVYVLLEVEGQGTTQEAGQEFLEEFLGGLFEQELIHDGIIAANSAQQKELWGLRENITECISANGHVRKNDISLAINQLSPFIQDLEKFISTLSTNIELILFGHIGDGNIHINYVAPFEMDKQEFISEAKKIESDIFKILASFRGSISAEHGIGLLKKGDLHYSRGELELELMRGIKKQFDPQVLMNPGKIFDL